MRSEVETVVVEVEDERPTVGGGAEEPETCVKTETSVNETVRPREEKVDPSHTLQSPVVRHEGPVGRDPRMTEH